MRHELRSPAIAVLLCTATGCASIVTGHNQPLSVETRSKGVVTAGANCQLQNDKGTWFVTTPGSVMVQRSAADMSVRCEKNGYEPGLATVKSTTKAMAFGNILFGGIVGGAVDVATGAAFDYPSLISVELGSSQTLGGPTAQAEQAPSP